MYSWMISWMDGYKKYGSSSCSSVLPNQSSYGVGNWLVEEENLFI